MDRVINKWINKLDIVEITIKTESILDEQVVYPDGVKDKNFVGICCNDKNCTIYHSRKLTEEDIIHELLHVKYPNKSEEWVINKTKKYLNNENT